MTGNAARGKGQEVKRVEEDIQEITIQDNNPTIETDVTSEL